MFRWNVRWYGRYRLFLSTLPSLCPHFSASNPRLGPQSRLAVRIVSRCTAIGGFLCVARSREASISLVFLLKWSHVDSHPNPCMVGGGISKAMLGGDLVIIA